MEHLHSVIFMARNKISENLFYLNSLISISTESTVSKELAVAVIVIAIILKKKKTNHFL